MARTFGSYGPVVPLGTTWEETFQLLQADGVTPVNLTGYAARMMIRTQPQSLYGGVVGAVPLPLLELTTQNFYSSAPPWPSYAGPATLTAQPSWNGLFITPATGTINLAAAPNVLGFLSPNNLKVKLIYDLEVVTPTAAVAPPTESEPITWPAGIYVLPVLSGKLVVSARVTF